MEHYKKKAKKVSKKTRKPNTAWHKKFVDALTKTRSIGQACKVAGVGRTTAYNHKDKFPDFSDEWEEAMQMCIDDLEASALRRAIEGHNKAVFHAGQQIGEVLHHETSLTIFMLKALKPEVYNMDINANDVLTADQTAQAVRVAVEAMKQSVPNDE